MSSKSQKQKKRNKIIALFIVLTLVVSVKDKIIFLNF